MFGFLTANLVMLPLGLILARIMGNIVKIPAAILAPIITVLAVLGAYCIRGRLFDIYVVAAFGLLGYFMKKAHYAPGAFALGRLLASLGEVGLRRSLVLARGDLVKFYLGRPACVILILLILFNIFSPLMKMLKARQKFRAETTARS
jgi:putative tricarboxylic transport membrane protein